MLLQSDLVLDKTNFITVTMCVCVGGGQLQGQLETGGGHSRGDVSQCRIAAAHSPWCHASLLLSAPGRLLGALGIYSGVFLALWHLVEEVVRE